MPLPALKLMVVGRRRPGTTLAEHRHHIRHVHGELVLRYIAADPANAPRRYAQNAVFDGDFRGAAPKGDSWAPNRDVDTFTLNRDFVTQIWFPDLAALGRSRETAFYREQLQGDEDHFVDQATVVFMPVRERVLLAGAEWPIGGCKLFGLLQRSPGSPAEPFRDAWSNAPANWYDALPAAARPLRHVRNDVMAPPGGTAPLDGIDEFWLADETGARALLTHWRAWAEARFVDTGLAAAASPFALLAHEAVLHAGDA